MGKQPWIGRRLFQPTQSLFYRCSYWQPVEISGLLFFQLHSIFRFTIGPIAAAGRRFFSGACVKRCESDLCLVVKGKVEKHRASAPGMRD